MATIHETLEALRQPIPRALFKTKVRAGQRLVYVPWYRAVALADERAPGWCHEIREVGERAGRVYVNVRITLLCDDGAVYREATGNELEELDSYGDPFSNAESMAIRRAFAKFGLALYLYDAERRGEVQRSGDPRALVADLGAEATPEPAVARPAAGADDERDEADERGRRGGARPKDGGRRKAA